MNEFLRPSQDFSEEEIDPESWEGQPQGENPGAATNDHVSLVHQALDRFPELLEKYKRFAGPAAVLSTSLIILTAIAISHRRQKGEHPDKILKEITEDEILNGAIIGAQKRTEELIKKNKKPKVK